LVHGSENADERLLKIPTMAVSSGIREISVGISRSKMFTVFTTMILTQN
jgi:hypothetical protein